MIIGRLDHYLKMQKESPIPDSYETILEYVAFLFKAQISDGRKWRIIMSQVKYDVIWLDTMPCPFHKKHWCTTYDIEIGKKEQSNIVELERAPHWFSPKGYKLEDGRRYEGERRERKI